EPVDSLPSQDLRKAHSKQPYFSYMLSSLLLFSMLFISSSTASNALPIVTITLFEKLQPVTLSSTLHVGRMLDPISLSQSKTTPTTGHGHQDTKRAVGTLTFYNGLFTSQFIPQGTVFTGQDRMNIVTAQSASIPPGNP